MIEDLPNGYYINNKHKYKKLYGVGINDAEYPVTKHIKIIISPNQYKYKKVWQCPYYSKWADMLCRCYASKHKKKNPTYQGCSVCDKWLLFSNFKSWMEQQDWEGKQLDKDLLVYKNKVYSPETCVFLYPRLNGFLVKVDARRGLLPIGVSYRKLENGRITTRKKPYECHISDGSKRLFIGYFKTPEEAHRAWQKAKASLSFDIAVNQADLKVTEGFLRVFEKILNDYEQRLETIDY